MNMDKGYTKKVDYIGYGMLIFFTAAYIGFAFGFNIGQMSLNNSNKSKQPILDSLHTSVSNKAKLVDTLSKEMSKICKEIDSLSNSK